jgi:hypothetical protein
VIFGQLISLKLASCDDFCTVPYPQSPVMVLSLLSVSPFVSDHDFTSQLAMLMELDNQ